MRIPTILHDDRIMMGTALTVLVAAVAIAPMVRLLSNVRASDLLGTSHLSLRPSPAKRVAVVHRKAAAAPHAIQMGNTLILFSTLQDYTFTFSGLTLCGGASCAARVEVMLEPDGLEPVWKSITAQEDGSFSFEVPFKARPHQVLDWTVTLRDADNHMLQTGGRQILTGDRNPELKRTFDIH